MHIDVPAQRRAADVHGAMRVLRGTIVGAAILAIAMLGHGVSGGAMHLWSATFLALGALTVALAVWLSQREWTLIRLLVALGLAQVVIHYALEFSARSTAMDAMPNMPDMPNMPMVHASHYNGLTMFFGHVAAVLVTAMVLRHGELWWVALRDLLAVVLGRLAVAVDAPLDLGLTLPRFASVALVRRTRYLEHSLRRRGPPVLVHATV